jgi:membrane-associated protein
MHEIRELLKPEVLVATVGLLGIVAIVFAETGLLVGFFLPGDSLLVTAGIFCTPHNPTGKAVLNAPLLIALTIIAAIVGDTVGYWIGKKAGRKIFSREDSFFFHRKHLLASQNFYEKHGGKTIVMARFMPIVRTFAPVVAGVGNMEYSRFVRFNIGGAIGWVVSMVMAGYVLAYVAPGVTKHIELLALVIIFLSLLPAIIGYLKNRFARA